MRDMSPAALKKVKFPKKISPAKRLNHAQILPAHIETDVDPTMDSEFGRGQTPNLAEMMEDGRKKD